MNIKVKPNTFYELIQKGSGQTDYFYYSLMGYMISLYKTGRPFTEYCFNDLDYFDGSRYSSGREYGEMQIYWVYDAQHDYAEVLVCPLLDFPKVRKYYEGEFNSFGPLRTLSDFHSILTTRGLERLAIPEIGCITDEVMFFSGFSSPIYELIDKDFFSDQEICRLYGITDTDITDYLLSGKYQSREKLPWGHCFYKYGSYVFYISSRREDAEPCWFKWREDYNCYVQVSSPGHIIPTKAQPLLEELTLGCVDNGFNNSLDLALREGKSRDGMCSLGEALAHVMDNSRERVISLGDEKFILDYENRRIHYNRPWAFVEDETKWPFLELTSRISLE